MTPHEFRNRLAPFASAVEAIRTLVDRGLVDLSGFPGIRAQLDHCRRLLEEIRREAPAAATPPATEDRP